MRPQIRRLRLRRSCSVSSKVRALSYDYVLGAGVQATAGDFASDYVGPTGRTEKWLLEGVVIVVTDGTSLLRSKFPLCQLTMELGRGNLPVPISGFAMKGMGHWMFWTQLTQLLKPGDRFRIEVRTSLDSQNIRWCVTYRMVD